ncbi:MAG: winged helix-turn-helix domain-containing protein [Phycisphaerales bacterium]|nr:winged helix-turn-helix domain-containing protein [Phycisphaerales bacterium]MCI0629297.1 winged helix-turn-helix domain-containing protein [Phycisphaerales bacterium]MCI0676360.1 winged helix-turn-helix domain-containing protein [Phycisphaerales bacterium]
MTSKMKQPMDKSKSVTKAPVATEAGAKPKRAAETKPQRQVQPKPPKRSKGSSERMSALDAAAKVLKDHGQPMNCGEIVEAMLKRGLWSTNGKTPSATLYSALLRQIQTKGKDAQFRRIGRGKFALAK